MMSDDCGGCLNVIPTSLRLLCRHCQLWFDLKCANISPKRFKSMSIKSRTLWICPGCRSEQPKGDNRNIPVRTTHLPAGPTNIPVLPTQNPAASHSTKQKSRSSSLSKSANHTTTKAEGSRTSPTSLQVDNKDQAEDTPIPRGEKIAEQIASTLKHIVVEQVQNRELIKSFQQTISSFSNRCDELKNDLEQKSSKIDNLEVQNAILRESLLILKRLFCDLTKRVNITEQHARSCNVEIQCVPESKSENLVTNIVQLSKSIKCDINDSDIQYCTRVAKKTSSNSCPRFNLVKLSSPRQSDSFLAPSKKLNGYNPNNRHSTCHPGLGATAEKAQPILVEEHLSPENKSLHAAARSRAKEFKFLWVKNGYVFVRQTEDVIDLNSYLCSDAEN